MHVFKNVLRYPVGHELVARGLNFPRRTRRADSRDLDFVASDDALDVRGKGSVQGESAMTS